MRRRLACGSEPAAGNGDGAVMGGLKVGALGVGGVGRVMAGASEAGAAAVDTAPEAKEGACDGCVPASVSVGAAGPLDKLGLPEYTA
jgi:hypothetical protein